VGGTVPHRPHHVLQEEPIHAHILNPTTVAARLFATRAQVLEDAQILTSIIGWLLHERDSLPSRMALGQTALVSKECRRYISRQTCFWRPVVRDSKCE